MQYFKLKNQAGLATKMSFFTAMISLIMLLFTVSIPVVPAFAGDKKLFSDIPASDPVYYFVKYLHSSGLMAGYPDGTFHPGSTITRAEIISLLARAEKLEGYTPDKPTFLDVKSNHWAYPMIEAAVKAGLTSGYPDGTFHPEAPVTRAETAVLLFRLTKQAIPAIVLPSTVKDVAGGYWAFNQVAASLDANIIIPTSQGQFAPEDPATRGQVAYGLARMLTLAPEFNKVPLNITLDPLKGNTTITQNDKSTPVKNLTACSPGMLITTGKDSEAKLSFPDGSSILLQANTVLGVKDARGQAYITQDGSPGTAIDWVQINLTKGKIFGALAPQNPIVSTGNTTSKTSSLTNTYQGLKPLRVGQEQSQLPWWKKVSASRERLEVDMPWGMAGIRQTFWSNSVDETGKCSCSVGEGQVSFSSGGQSISIAQGQQSSVTSQSTAPAAPTTMTTAEQKAWNEVTSWITSTVTQIVNNSPIKPEIIQTSTNLFITVQPQQQQEQQQQLEQQQQQTNQTQDLIKSIVSEIEAAVSGQTPSPSISSGNSSTSSPSVQFSDANLEAAVRTALAKPSGNITNNDMLNLIYLNASGKSIASLSGLEYAANLVSLNLDNNQITNLSPLSGLTNLMALNLHQNQISDISSLAGLSKLYSLMLGSNSVSDISPLAQLTGLQSLYIADNQISNLAALTKLTSLNYLDLSQNQISNQIPGMSETGDNLSVLAFLSNLLYLDLSSNSIQSISSLSGLTNLCTLYLGSNQISDISILEYFSQLTALSLANNTQISSISTLSNLHSLQSLSLGGTGISPDDLASLFNTQEYWPQSLQILDLNNINLSDISFLIDYHALTDLSLSNNNICDLSPLSGLSNLTYLNLSSNQLIDVSYLLYNTGLGEGDAVDLRSNSSLSPSAALAIQTLLDRGVNVLNDLVIPIDKIDQVFMSQNTELSFSTRMHTTGSISCITADSTNSDVVSVTAQKGTENTSQGYTMVNLSINAINSGKESITLTAGKEGSTGSLTFPVIVAPFIEKIEAQYLYFNQTIDIPVYIYPQDGTDCIFCSNTEIASVDKTTNADDLPVLRITAGSTSGSTDITLTVPLGIYSYSCTFTVTVIPSTPY